MYKTTYSHMTNSFLQVIRVVFSIIGLPCYIITNCGHDFLEKMLEDIERRWNGEHHVILFIIKFTN